MEDSQILFLLNSDKNFGFKMLFAKYYRPMCIYSKTILKQEENAEDIVQDILMSLWDRNDYKSIGNLKNYLYTSTKNRSLNALNRKKIDVVNEDVLDWENNLLIEEDDLDLVKEKVKVVKNIIEKLPTSKKKIFKAVILDGSKYSQAAEDLGLSINTVKSQMRQSYYFINERLKKNILFFTFIYTLF